MAVLDRAEFNPQPEPALQRATFFAREMHVPVDLLLCEYRSPHVHLVSGREGEQEALRVHLEEAQAWLTKAAEPLLKEGLHVACDVVRDRRPYDAIMDKATALQPDIIVKTTRHDTTLNRTLFNYTDWHLIRTCPCPLLLAKSEGDWATRRIVACVNPARMYSNAETLDNEIIEVAQRLAYRLRGELHIFHSIESWPFIGPLTSAESGGDTDPKGAIFEEHREAVENLLRPYGIGQRRVHLKAGNPARTLLPFVEELDASLVVMGAVSKGAFKTLLIGNTAERVLDALRCDILVVKSQPLTVEAEEPSACLSF